MCKGYGEEVWNEETGEVVVCMGAGAKPLCKKTPKSLAAEQTDRVVPEPIYDWIPNLRASTICPPCPCTESTTTTITTTTPTPRPCENPASCVNKNANQIYPHQNCNCKQFYICRTPVMGGSTLILQEYTCGSYNYNPTTNECTADASFCP